MASSSLVSVVSFDCSHVDRVIALWLGLHPDWTWLEDPAAKASLFETRDRSERLRFVVQSGDVVIASAFSSLAQDPAWTRNRIIDLRARPEDVRADWLGIILASFATADRGQPGTWQVVNAAPCLSPVLAPLLEANGFSFSFKVWRLEWRGESVTVVDPAPIRLERYTGGCHEIDAAIADLHNLSYRAARPKPSVDPDTLWRARTGWQTREYLLAMGDGRLVGFVEWCVIDGEAWIANIAVARTHWGAAIGDALVTQSIQYLVELGHRKVAALVRSTNAAVMRLSRELGCKVAAELSETFVRKFDSGRADKFGQYDAKSMS
jgi:ribosomal protein S18 acetylase RimI-like enzyme